MATGLLAVGTINEIHLNFTHHNRDYVVFSTNHSKFFFLYFKHEKKPIRSLFYGDNFLTLISSYLNDSNVECIECQLGIHIKGGISVDGSDQVNFNITRQESNKILKKLKKKLRTKTNYIDYF
ncbi:MAG: hypothetical protein EU532_01800 [Promethearchaeota archaeon]|nr:MAG: hypothetical protein EU532_01800 [Candidatus Lokiarchaeota archaeon]